MNNSSSFTNILVNLMESFGIESSKYEVIEAVDLNFNFFVNFVKTSNSPLLECYSLIFERDGRKILYTSDSNDIDNVKEKANDKSFYKIYCDVGVNSQSHINFEKIKELDKEKLVLMHLSNFELYKKVLKEGFSVPKYLQ